MKGRGACLGIAMAVSLLLGVSAMVIVLQAAALLVVLVSIRSRPEPGER